MSKQHDPDKQIQVQQLKLAVKILEAELAGKPIPWQAYNSDAWVDPTWYCNPPNVMSCVHRGVLIRLDIQGDLVIWEEKEEPWIEFEGGVNPIPSQNCEVRLANGMVYSDISDSMTWERRWPKNYGSKPAAANTDPWDIVGYRLSKPAIIHGPSKVEFGPDDAPPGTVFRLKRNEKGYQTPDDVDEEGVVFNGEGGPFKKTWGELKSWFCNRSLPHTGIWNENAWEHCQK